MTPLHLQPPHAMCEHSLALFKRDWDCGPEQVQDWARAAGVAAPRIVAQT